MNRKIPFKLDQDITFVYSFIPFDFRKNMGQLAIELTYTNGDTQMLTTESTNPNHRGTYEFDSDEDYFEFIKQLKLCGIPQVKSNRQ